MNDFDDIATDFTLVNVMKFGQALGPPDWFISLKHYILLTAIWSMAKKFVKLNRLIR